MARPDEPLNHENLSLIVAVYQSIVNENPKAWIKSKSKGEVKRSIIGRQIAPARPIRGRITRIAPARPIRGRITRDVCGYKITVMCERGDELMIRMSAPGWAVNLRGINFTGRLGERGYAINRMGELFTTRIHFTHATAQGLDKFKHQMTLVTMFADLPLYRPVTGEGGYW